MCKCSGIPQGLNSIESACNAGDSGDAGSRVQSLSQEDALTSGNPLQYSCQENPMDRGAWRAIVHGVTKSRNV